MKKYLDKPVLTFVLMKSNTGKKVKYWLDTLDANKSDIVKGGIMSHSSMYSMFEKKEVPWKHIIRMHQYLRRFYAYDIKDFFPDFPDDLNSVQEKIEHFGSEKDVIVKLQSETLAWKDRYMSLLEKHAQLQDKLINDITKMMTDAIAAQNLILKKLMDKPGQK